MTPRAATAALILATAAIAGACRDPGTVEAAQQAALLPEENLTGLYLPEGVSEEDRLFHESLIVFDSHLDTPANFVDSAFDLSADNPLRWGRVQVDLPKMERGGLDGGFWVVYTGQGPLTEEAYAAASAQALLRASLIREAAARHDELVLASTADEAEAAARAGQRVILGSIENSYPLGENVALLDAYYALGVRMVGPVHFRDNQFSDSATDLGTIDYGGLSPLGEALVQRANDLGMVIDASHASDEAAYDMIALSRTPIVLSHSGPDGAFDHPRNVPDELLLALAQSGGVIQVNAFGSYLEPLEAGPERAAALARLEAEFGAPSELDAAQLAEYRAARQVVDAAHPPPRSSFEVFLDHLFYALELVGPDHVGIGADWDGGGGVVGMEDVSQLPRITAALREAGYSDADIAKIWSGNLMRLLRNAEAAKLPAD